MLSTKLVVQCTLLNLQTRFVSNIYFAILRVLSRMDSTSTVDLQSHSRPLVMLIGLAILLIASKPMDFLFISATISYHGAPRSNPQLRDQVLKQSTRQSPMQHLKSYGLLLFFMNSRLSHRHQHYGVITYGLHVS